MEGLPLDYVICTRPALYFTTAKKISYFKVLGTKRQPVIERNRNSNREFASDTVKVLKSIRVSY